MYMYKCPLREVLTYLFPLCAIAAEAAATSLFKGSFGDFRVCSPGHDGAITAMPSVLAASRRPPSSQFSRGRLPRRATFRLGLGVQLL